MNPVYKLFLITLIYIEARILAFWSDHTSNIKRLWWIGNRLDMLCNKIESLKSK